MNTAVRKMPIGIQSFEDIRRGGYIYVDKTALIYELVTRGKPYFLSRPRRFGKSLLISTLEAYFLGKKELFKGLAIEKLEQDWITYPVLHLDLNAEKYNSPEALIAILSSHLTRWEDVYGKGEDETTLSTRFAGIIRRANEQTGRQVVVLIDEYDKPLLQVFSNEALLANYRATLKAFYGVLKSADPYLKFVFLTGVTKFAHVSVFSDLNQLKDISMFPAYSGICGITLEELKQNFQPEIEAVARENGYTCEETPGKLAHKYDGYHFRENTPGMFNPFSLLNALDSLKLDNFWFQTGTPTFLVELLKQSEFDMRQLIDGIETEASAFTEYRMEANNPIPLIYQSGYLTIKDYNREFGLYKLQFPNEEVRYGFLSFIAPFYSSISDSDKGFYIGKFVRELRAGDVDAFLTRLRAFFADFPYELNARTERHYQVVFYIVFKLMGQFCDAEVRSARGRADAVVKTKDHIYVFEFKLDGSAGEALAQIDSKGYLIPYTADGRQLVRVGVSFDAGERNIGEWKIG
ncbi:ATP-binding protein [Parabacteroides sp.]